MFLNTGSYIRRVLGGTERAIPPNLDRIKTVFETLMWFYCVNLVTNAIEGKKLYVNLNYRSGNIIGLVVHRTCSTWTQLMQHVGNETLSVQILPYMRYKDKRGCYESLRSEDGFSAFCQRESLKPSVSTIRSGAGVDETASGCNPETDHAMNFLAFALLLKLKQIVCNNYMYTLQDEHVLNFPSIRSLHRAHGTALPFVFSKLDSAAVETLNI